MQQANVTRPRAVKALRNNDKDIVNAIMVSVYFVVTVFVDCWFVLQELTM